MYGVSVGVIIIMDHEDATYPPSVEDRLRTADNVPQKAAVTKDSFICCPRCLYKIFSPSSHVTVISSLLI